LYNALLRLPSRHDRCLNVIQSVKPDFSENLDILSGTGAITAIVGDDTSKDLSKMINSSSDYTTLLVTTKMDSVLPMESFKPYQIVDLRGPTFSIGSNLESYESYKSNLLSKVQELVESFGASPDYYISCETADIFLQHLVVPRWNAYVQMMNQWEPLKSAIPLPELQSMWPFQNVYPLAKSSSINELISNASECFVNLKSLFYELEQLRPLELLPSEGSKIGYILSKLSKFIITNDLGLLAHFNLIRTIPINELIVVDAAEIPLCTSLIGLLASKAYEGLTLTMSSLVNVPNTLLPFIRACPTLSIVQSTKQGRVDYLIKEVEAGNHYLRVEPALPDKAIGDILQGQNYAAAEYSVALYQLLRLRGYERIAIGVETLKDMRLVEMIYELRCSWTSFYGKPEIFIQSPPSKAQSIRI